MPGKFSTQASTPSTRPGTALERKFSTFENYQVRVAEEGAQIINEKLREKITELDELCMSGKFNISRLSEIREYTTTSVQTYLDEVKRIEKKAAAAQAGGNPLLQLLAGGMGGGGGGAEVEGEEGEEMYNPEDDLEAEEIAMPKKLLLSRMGLDEDNKINLKLSLELELPEKAKKAEKSDKAEKNEESSENTEKSESKKRENEDKNVESEEPETKKARRTTRNSKKSKKSKKGGKAEEEEEDDDIEADNEAGKQTEAAENKESSMSVTENDKSDEKSEEKSSSKKASSKTKKDDEEEDDEEMPVLHSHPEIYKLSTELRRHIDVILDWITTIQQWIQSGMTRNKNIGGADIQTEIQNAMLEELGVAAQEFTAHKEIMAAYYISRAAVLEKYVKSPEFEDYKNFLVDEDEKQFVQLRTIVISMRNSTVNLFDGLTKESDTIFNQSGSGKQDNYAAFSMY
jgi:hypothetical protein